MLLHTALGGGGQHTVVRRRQQLSRTTSSCPPCLPTSRAIEILSADRSGPPPKNSQGVGRGCHGKGHCPTTRGLQLAKDDDVDWCRVPQRHMQRISLQPDRLVERHCDSPDCRDVGGVSRCPDVEMTIYPGGPCCVSERIRRAGQGTKLFTKLTNLVGVARAIVDHFRKLNVNRRRPGKGKTSLVRCLGKKPCRCRSVLLVIPKYYIKQVPSIGTSTQH